MPYINPSADLGFPRRRRRPFDPLDPLASEDELLLDEEGMDEPGAAAPVMPASAPPPARPPMSEPPSLPPAPPSASPLPPKPPTPPAPPVKSGLDNYADTIRNMPQRPAPGLLRGLLATGAAALGGFYNRQIPQEQTQQAVDNILYPGYGRQMEDWGRQTQAMGALADIEAKQAHERRLETQHQASLKSEEAQLASEKARQEYYRSRQNMPPKPERFTTYEAFLVSKVQNGTPEERAAAEKKLSDLKAKNSPEKNLIVKEVEDEIGGTKTLIFYDPVTGEKKKEEKFTARKRPAGTTPLSQNTLDYRQKLSKARDLAGQALRLFPNDKSQARAWLAQQTNDDEVFEMAMERIGTPAATRTNRREEVLKAFGITGTGTGGEGGGSTPNTRNPYRNPGQK